MEVQSTVFLIAIVASTAETKVFWIAAWCVTLDLLHRILGEKCLRA